MAEQHQHHSPLIRALLGHQATLSTRLHDAAAKKDYERAGRAYVERQETRVLLKENGHEVGVSASAPVADGSTMLLQQHSLDGSSSPTEHPIIPHRAEADEPEPEEKPQSPLTLDTLSIRPQSAKSSYAADALQDCTALTQNTAEASSTLIDNIVSQAREPCASSLHTTHKDTIAEQAQSDLTPGIANKVTLGGNILQQHSSPASSEPKAVALLTEEQDATEAHRAPVQREGKAPRIAVFAELPRSCPGTKYTHIVKIEDNDWALVCYVCEATGTTKTKYFGGLRGYHLHVIVHETELHKTRKQVIETALEHGSLPIVSADDIGRIMAGSEPLHVRPPFRGNMQVATSAALDRSEAGTERRSSASVTETGIASTRMQTPYPQLHPTNYRNVVQFINGWHSISCNICGASVHTKSTSSKEDFLDGIKGLSSHMRLHSMERSKGQASYTFDECARLCNKVKVDEDDVRRIAAGGDPVRPIVAKVGYETTLTQSLANSKKSLASVSSTDKGAFKIADDQQGHKLTGTSYPAAVSQVGDSIQSTTFALPAKLLPSAIAGHSSRSDDQVRPDNPDQQSRKRRKSSTLPRDTSGSDLQSDMPAQMLPGAPEGKPMEAVTPVGETQRITKRHKADKLFVDTDSDSEESSKEGTAPSKQRIPLAL